LMWLGEQITERGIGNGISLIIFAGIVARFFPSVLQTFQLVRIDQISIFLLIIIVALMIAVVTFIVFVERGQRRIPVQYAKRVVGRKMYGGQSTHLPLKINTSGVIPPIFASSIIMFPATIASFIDVSNIPWLEYIVGSLNRGGVIYNLIYVVFIIFFCFFYTAVHFNPVDVADNMKRYGGFIPGIRPGKNSAEYIDRVLTRITFSGAIYVSAVCVLPQILITKFGVPFYFGGTSLLIVVGVAMDTASQIESHMLTRHYEGFLKKGLARVR
ncbi:MAG: preprotein translocase subunit SecY, partial [Deltaproteobacteria bacterium RBG_19FT_COMBO_46_9]